MRKTTLKTIYMRGDFLPYVGYGLHSIKFIEECLRRGVRPWIKPLTVVEDGFGATLEPHIKRYFHDLPDPSAEFELVIHPPSFEDGSEFGSLTGVKKLPRIHWTMWETDQLPPRYVQLLNTCAAVIVPCKWNYESFKKSGVRVPIYVVPLGTDTAIFKPSYAKHPTVFTVGTAARTAHGGIRKGVDDVAYAFLRAFPTETDVKLTIKIFPDCQLLPIWATDPRIEVIRAFLPLKEFVNWYQALSIYCSGAAAEGWGLHQHEAMCCAKPIISVDYGGVQEFFSKNNGLVVKHHLVDAFKKVYQGVGKWARPDSDSMVEQLRWAYENQVKLPVIGERAYQKAKRFSKTFSHDMLFETLEKIKRDHL